MAVKQQQFQLTQEGVDKLKSELQFLKEVKRPENIESLKEARAQGDLSENADYDAARNEQARIESRIQEIETIVKNVKLIRKTAEDKINIGKSVKVLFVDRNEEKTFDLVGSLEVDPLVNKISVESAIGKALLDFARKKEESEDKNVIGSTITVKTETGKIFDIKILEIS
ncbi:transcription elongation factor GreA [Mariniplasma anaerobium]|uniref:Transcription elongation factor GreA n=1 Tax=Mariniplasma anaerobium TaxID=2735436 RepID=A0A7U9XV04_9MOLU|nr:transcription elongation factor GreA [Mariniplasma anaerobium]BCR35633.1 transcription elongation factor GreA [Mariniplasma anaerobium]